MGRTTTWLFATLLLCTSCTTFIPQGPRLIRNPDPIVLVGEYFQRAPFSSSKLVLNPDQSFAFSYEMMDSYVEGNHPDDGPFFFGEWENALGKWTVMGNELHLSFQTPTKKEIEETYFLYLHKDRSILVPEEQKTIFFRSIKFHPESYNYSTDEGLPFRIGLLKNEDNQTVQTTSASRRV